MKHYSTLKKSLLILCVLAFCVNALYSRQTIHVERILDDIAVQSNRPSPPEGYLFYLKFNIEGVPDQFKLPQSIEERTVANMHKPKYENSQSGYIVTALLGNNAKFSTEPIGIFRTSTSDNRSTIRVKDADRLLISGNLIADDTVIVKLYCAYKGPHHARGRLLNKFLTEVETPLNTWFTIGHDTRPETKPSGSWLGSGDPSKDILWIKQNYQVKVELITKPELKSSPQIHEDFIDKIRR